MVASEIADAILVAVVGIILIQGLWLSFLTYNMFRKSRAERERQRLAEDEQKEAERSTIIEDVFLLHRSGLLLKHYTRRLRPNVDSDVLSGMLVAVQDFVKDSFRGEAGRLDEIRFGEMRIVIAEGKWTFIAGIVRGKRVVDIMPEMRAALADIESLYEDLLLGWDGTLDQFPEIDGIVQGLLRGKYRGATLEPGVKVVAT